MAPIQRKRPFGRVALGLACAAALLIACAPTEEEIQEEFDEYVADRNQCTVVDECTVISPGCPLGCGVGVRTDAAQDVRAKARELIDDYESGGETCEYGCPLLVADCVEGRCQAVTESG